MKKYAAVPFICKVKRLARKVLNSGVKIKKSTVIGFSKKKDIEPDKTYTLGNEYFISVKTLCIALVAILGAVLGALLTAKICFEIAVFKKSRK